MSTKISRRRNGNISGKYQPLDKGNSTGTDGGPEKTQGSQPSVKSPRRAGMSGRTAKVKTRAKSRYHKTQVEGFEGPT